MFRAVVLLFIVICLTGCQIPYLLKNSWHQTKILKSRVPIDEVLNESNLTDEQRKKLLLVKKAKRFATDTLGLESSRNYETYVDLKRPYVTWVVRAAPAFELKPHNWWFPIVGSVPYKGYFSIEGAKSEAKRMKEKGLDIYIRGVSAYSTLGWFSDPVLSSMLNYTEHDLVNVIIHELVHATIFIEGHVDFNERLATFVGNKGAELFYKSVLKNSAETLELIKRENYDQEIFSEFITRELKSLREFYKKNEGKISVEQKQARLKEIQTRFAEGEKPKLLTDSFEWFEKRTLNNAILLSLETYQSDLSDFQKLYDKLGEDFQKLIEACKKLEDEENPEQALKELVSET